MPTPNGSNGRDKRGRFVRGNPGGPGNPNAKKIAIFRKAVLDAVSETDVKNIISAMVSAASAGDVNAAKFVISYVVGTPSEVEWESDRYDKEKDFGLLKSIPRELLIQLAKNPDSYRNGTKTSIELT